MEFRLTETILLSPLDTISCYLGHCTHTKTPPV